MIETERVLATNRAGWNQVAPSFYGGTALPEYGPLAPTEDTLRLLEVTPELRALELGCGSGHSLRYLAERGAREVWGLDLSSVQVAFAEETLRDHASRSRLFESPMEVNPGIPSDYFDLVFSLWGLGWTTDLPATMALVAEYLRPGGCFLLSGEHPAYSCLEWNGSQYVVSEPSRRRRSSGTRVVEGCADRDPAPHACDGCPRDHRCGAADRGPNRSPVQPGSGDRRS